MSVAIIIADPQTKADILFEVPVAASEVFDQIWVPAAENLGLIWMPMFSTGLSVGKADLPEIRQEFVTMRDWFTVNFKNRKGFDYLVGRANLAIAGLDQIMARADEVDLFIG